MTTETGRIYDRIMDLINHAAGTLPGKDYDELLGEVFSDVEARVAARTEEGNPD